METAAIVVERVYNAPAKSVWQAITEVDIINQWFFQLNDFKAEVGFAFEFSGNDNGTKVVHQCVVITVIPEKKLSYSLIYSGYPQQSLVTYELFEEGEQTRFVLTHSNLDELSKGSPLFARHKFFGGWTYLANKLNNLLN